MGVKFEWILVIFDSDEGTYIIETLKAESIDDAIKGFNFPGCNLYPIINTDEALKRSRAILTLDDDQLAEFWKENYPSECVPERNTNISDDRVYVLIKVDGKYTILTPTL